MRRPPGPPLPHCADPSGVELLDVSVGIRPMPADGSPVIGPVPGAGGVYLAVLHSGATLAPTVGRLVAAELAGHADAAEFRALRPARFGGGASAGRWTGSVGTGSPPRGRSAAGRPR